MHENEFENLELPDDTALPLEYRVEKETSGMLRWRAFAILAELADSKTTRGNDVP